MNPETTIASPLLIEPMKNIDARRLGAVSARTRRVLRETAQHLDRGDLAACERTLTAAFALAGEHVECTRLEGVLLHRRGRLAEALDRLTQTSIRHPDDALILANLGAVQFACRDFDIARATLERACALSSDCAEAWFELAKLLDTQGHTSDARAAFEQFLKLRPDHLLARVGLAGTLKASGHIDDAATEYRHVIARNKRMYQAWFSLVDLKTIPLATRESAELEQLAADPSFAPAAQAALAFALGKVREDDGRPADAFAAFEKANAIMRTSGTWDAGAFSRGVDAVMRAFDGLPFAPAARRGEEVIFIVSLPRSGSTLVEQILAAHPTVEGASELPDLAGVLAEESTRRGKGFPQWVDAASDSDWQRLGERYLERTARWRTNHPYFTDKMPSNWRMLGAALRMLPGAHIIDCRRDALETCWSCYKQLFAPTRADYAYAFSDLAAYARDHDRMMDFWRARHGKHIRVQSYEALVADAPGQIREILDFCGLPFDAACLDFHRAERSTRTASAAQVRQPLQKGSARAAAYGALLDPLRMALGLATGPRT